MGQHDAGQKLLGVCDTRERDANATKTVIARSYGKGPSKALHGALRELNARIIDLEQEDQLSHSERRTKANAVAQQL